MQRLAGVTFIIIISRAVDCELESRSCQTKDYTISMCCFSDKHATLRRNSTDWLARNQNNVSEWGLTSTVVSVRYITIKMQRSVLVHSEPNLIAN